jgi:hypothetical protein
MTIFERIKFSKFDEVKILDKIHEMRTHENKI